MATKRPKGLGLGLEALLGPAVEAPTAGGDHEAPRDLPLAALQPGKYQPRTRIDDAALAELAESIRAQGVMQPVLVRPLAGGEGARWEIIAGERRVRAARLAGLDEVPVLVRDVTDQAAAAMALIENIQRADLNPIEEARGLKRLVDEFGLTHDAAAGAVGRSRSAATNLLRLLNLVEPVQRLVLDGALDMGHARALLALGGAEQVRAAQEIVAKKLSVREAERLAGRSSGGQRREGSRVAARRSSEVLRIEEALADRLAAPVRVRIDERAAGKRQRGEVSIAFASLDELDGLLERLGVTLA